MTATKLPKSSKIVPARRKEGVVGVIAVTVGIVWFGSDIVMSSLRPLTYLGILFPTALKHVPLIVPLSALLIWFACRRTTRSAVIGMLVSVVAIAGTALWAGSKVATIHVTRFLTQPELTALEAKLGFKVWEQGRSDGNEMSVERVTGRREQLQAEIERLGMVRYR